MGRITLDLIRRRAEHNNGEVTTLEEVTLHQFEIEKIELLDHYCKNLKIIYLQNNMIPKLEGLRKLKSLEYLNIGINNIERIENLRGCEKLNKLDMTLNFVDVESLEESCMELSQLPSLKTLYMTGNPCCDWAGFRDYMIHTVPQLKELDGKEIFPKDRIVAAQNFSKNVAELYDLAEARILEIMSKGGKWTDKGADDWCPQTRVEMCKESERIRLEKDAREKEQRGEKEKPERELPGVLNYRGEIRQCNEGGYAFSLEFDDYDGYYIFKLQSPKFLDTSKIDMDIQPFYIRTVIKEKVTQVRMEHEVETDSAKVTRNATTGELYAKIKLLNFERSHWRSKKTEENYVFRYDKDLVKKMREDEKKEAITKEVEKKLTEKEQKEQERQRLELENAPDIGRSNKSKDGKGDAKTGGKPKKIDYEELGYTEDDVPDLE